MPPSSTYDVLSAVSITLSIHGTNFWMFVYTPGRCSRPHPIPHDTNPISVFRPSKDNVNGPPESPWHESRPPWKKRLISLLTSSVINLSSTHLLVPSTQKDIVNSLSSTCCPEPPLTPLIGQHLHVHLLQYRRHRTLSMSCPTPARNCRHLARQFHLFPGQANR